VAHNAAFDLGFLVRLGFVPGTVHDTMLLSQLRHGTRHPRGFHGLEQCLQRELGQTITKDEQRTDWSGMLMRCQLDYAAADVRWLVPLYQKLETGIRETGQADVAAIERRCLPGLVWLAGSGIWFDAPAWQKLAADAEEETLRLSQALDATAPRPEQGGALLRRLELGFAGSGQSRVESRGHQR
jgi:ribonuclease D